VREGEISNRKYGRFVSRFEPLSLYPYLYRYEYFHYNLSRKIIWCHNTYNELPQELFDPQVPHLFPQKQYATRTRKFVEAATSTTPQI